MALTVRQLLWAPIDFTLKRLMGDQRYLAWVQWLAPRLDPRRRGVNVTMSLDDGLIVARDSTEPDSNILVFYSVSRAPRYLWPEGLLRIQTRMLRKYNVREDQCDRAVVVDIGANIGEFSLAMLRNGARHVYAIEPDSIANRCLVRNVKAFNERATTWQIACGREETQMEFYVASNTADSSTIRPARYDRVETVPVHRLDEITEIRALPRIDILKVEAEGAEPEVLEGCIDIAARVQMISVDVSPERQGESTETECENLLRSMGFRVLMTSTTLVGYRSEASQGAGTDRS